MKRLFANRNRIFIISITLILCASLVLASGLSAGEETKSERASNIEPKDTTSKEGTSESTPVLDTKDNLDVHGDVSSKKRNSSSPDFVGSEGTGINSGTVCGSVFLG